MVSRPYEADEVFVTGTFDDWGKTVQLDKKGSVFEKEVHLPTADEKIQYKVGRPERDPLSSIFFLYYPFEKYNPVWEAERLA